MRVAFAFLIAILPFDAVTAEEIGRVDTAFNWVGASKHIAIEAFDDPKVQGVTCYISMARRGGGDFGRFHRLPPGRPERVQGAD